MGSINKTTNVKFHLAGFRGTNFWTIVAVCVALDRQILLCPLLTSPSQIWPYPSVPWLGGGGFLLRAATLTIMCCALLRRPAGCECGWRSLQCPIHVLQYRETSSLTRLYQNPNLVLLGELPVFCDGGMTNPFPQEMCARRILAVANFLFLFFNLFRQKSRRVTLFTRNFYPRNFSSHDSEIPVCHARVDGTTFRDPVVPNVPRLSVVSYQQEP